MLRRRRRHGATRKEWLEFSGTLAARIDDLRDSDGKLPALSAKELEALMLSRAPQAVAALFWIALRGRNEKHRLAAIKEILDFSHRHIKAALHMQNAATWQAQVRIGRYDAGKSISYYGELLRAFSHLNMMIPVAAEDWFRIKKIAPQQA